MPFAGQRIGLDAAYHPLAISPDGRAVAYTVQEDGRLKLRLRRLDTREDIELAGTDGARSLFFSPDGEWIGFVGSRNPERGLVWGHHHPRFDLDEAAMALGMESMVNVALRYLNGGNG